MKTIAFATLACSLAVKADLTVNLEDYLAEYAAASVNKTRQPKSKILLSTEKSQPY